MKCTLCKKDKEIAVTLRGKPLCETCWQKACKDTETLK